MHSRTVGIPAASTLFISALLLSAAGCTGGDAAATGSAALATTAIATPNDADSAAQVAAAEPLSAGEQRVLELQRNPNAIIRALYLNRFAVQSQRRMQRLMDLADSTEVNAFVIDIKDEFGLNFVSDDPMLQRNAGTQTKAVNLKRTVDTLRARGILPIARIVVFNDSVTARNNPDMVIRKNDGTPWRDRVGIMWVDPYASAAWEYNLRVGDEAIRMGFGEIQFDYIRFPEPYRSLPQQVFTHQRGRGKTEALAEFLRTAKTRYDKQGVRTTADVFGLTTTVRGALEVGQAWEPLAREVDVLLPMVYPSHYPRGSFGIPVPNAEPHKVVHIAISRARERNEAIGLVPGEQVRPWLQAFTLGQPRYEAEHIRAQKQAVYDSGFDGWILWNPGSNYDAFIPALERTLESRRKNPPVRPPSVRLP